MKLYNKDRFIQIIREYYKYNWHCCGKDKNPDCPYDSFGEEEKKKIIDFINENL